MKNIFFFVVALLISSQTFAQARSFKQCSGDAAPRNELDTFCPRLEGIHLDGCCPPLYKSPPLTCNYGIIESVGQPYLAETSSLQCVGGVTVSVPCCRIQRRACVREPIRLPFLPRLLHRNTCCFENCPTADYWRAAPPKGGLSPEHVLTDITSCTDTVLPECSLAPGATADTCPADDPCPEPAPGPVSPPASPTPGTPAPPGPTAPPADPEPPAPPAPPKPPVDVGA